MVSERDRQIMARQAAALAEAETDDEGSPEWRNAVTEWLDTRRASMGIEPLKTEGEMHRRARSLGLLE